VSIGIGTSFFPRNFSTTGITRRNSSSAAIGSAPGRVDSPPTSTMSAPSAAIFRPCSMAFSAAKNFPPSENESGVTFNTPMISPCRERSKMRSPIFQSLPRIMDETNIPDTLFEAGDVDLSLTQHRRAIHVSVAFRTAKRQQLFFSRVAPHQFPLRNNVPFHCRIQLTPFRTRRQVQLAIKR